MSERTPLLPTSVQNSVPSVSDVQDALPSKETQLHLAEAMGALKAGKYPSQEQLSSLLTLLASSPILKPTSSTSRTARLGPEGTKVLASFKNLVNEIKKWGEEKNGDDLLQNLVWEVKESDLDVETDVPSASLPSKSELKKDSRAASNSLKTIGKLLITSPAFRSLGNEIILLSRDILADAAEEVADSAKDVAGKTRPSEKERSNGVDVEGLKKKGKEEVYHAKTGLTQAQAREKADEKVGDVKQYFDEKLPSSEEAKDALIQRLKEIVTQAQSNKSYHQSINTLISLVKKYVSKASSAADEVVDKTTVSDDDELAEQAGRDLKEFVERLAGKSLDPLIEKAKKAGEDVKDDPKLEAYFKAVEEYLDRILHDEGYIVSQRAYKKGSSLYDDGQSLLLSNPTWKADASALQDEITSFLTALTNDQSTANLVAAIERLSDDLTTAGSIGFASLKVDGAGLYRDFVDVMLPRLIGLVKEIPVPRVEFKSEDVDLVIDDLKLESASFIPDSIRFIAHNDFEFTQGYATYASEFDSTVRLRVKGLHFACSNIAYWVNYKSGFLPFEDSGVLDIEFGPEGISFDVTLENADEDARETFFVVKNVDVNITGFNYSIRNNNKWFATWLAKPALRKYLLSNITNTLEVQITEMLKSADFQLYGLQQRAIAATNAKPSPANYLKAIFSTSIFGGSDMGPVELGSKGIVKYGRRGEYVLHIGVDEDLFPGKPEGSASNSKRDNIRNKVHEAKSAVKSAVGASSTKDVKRQAQDVAGKAQKEGAVLDAKMKEKHRREAREEGWRSDAFNV